MSEDECIFCGKEKDIYGGVGFYHDDCRIDAEEFKKTVALALREEWLNADEAIAKVQFSKNKETKEWLMHLNGVKLFIENMAKKLNVDLKVK